MRNDFGIYCVYRLADETWVSCDDGAMVVSIDKAAVRDAGRHARNGVRGVADADAPGVGHDQYVHRKLRDLPGKPWTNGVGLHDVLFGWGRGIGCALTDIADGRHADSCCAVTADQPVGSPGRAAPAIGAPQAYSPFFNGVIYDKRDQITFCPCCHDGNERLCCRSGDCTGCH